MVMLPEPQPLGPTGQGTNSYPKLSALLGRAGIRVTKRAIQSDNFVSGTSGWQLTAEGNLEASNGTFRGAISGSTIDIGGADATSFHVSANGDMWLGAATIGTAPFKVTNVGNVTATSGTIAGWSLASGEFSSGSVKLQSTNERILIGSATAPLTGTGIFIGKDGVDYEFRAGDPAGNYIHWDNVTLTIVGAISGGSIDIGGADATSFHVSANGDMWLGASAIGSAPFKVTNNGVLTATGATISGTITATAGSIGGWTLGSSTLTGGSLVLNSSGTITGGTIRTASSGQRVQMSDVAGIEHRLSIYNSSDQLRFVARSSALEFYEGANNLVGTIFGFASGMEWETNSGYDITLRALSGGIIELGSDTLPDTDNTFDLGSSSFRWADLRSVLINGADIGFENGWKFREWPAAKKDVGKPIEWMRSNANLGIQLRDENEKLVAVIHRDGYIYCKGFRPIESLPQQETKKSVSVA